MDSDSCEHHIIDPVWGTIALPTWVWRLTTTAVFNRLRHLKQLGMAYLTFPGATHSRASHSIGVAWLALRLMQSLKTKSPELASLDPAVSNSVLVAALCHDLGHGPMSHAFDWFIHEFEPAWTHEVMSLLMLDLMVESEPWVSATLREHHVDLGLVKAFIMGKPLCLLDAGWTPACGSPIAIRAEGAPQVPTWAWQVVSDSLSGMDVDRLDYLARDAYFVGLPSKVPVDAILASAEVVIMPDCTTCIAWPDTMVSEVFSVFSGRFNLHLQVYSHGSVRVAGIMAMEALKALHAGGWSPFQDAPHKTLVDAARSPALYLRLSDWVIDNGILGCLPGMSKPQFAPTRQLFQDIARQALWGLVAEHVITVTSTSLTAHAISAALCEFAAVTPDMFVVDVAIVHFGRHELDPMENVVFTSRRRPSLTTGVKLTTTTTTTTTHQRKCIRVFAKQPSSEDCIRAGFTAWLKHTTLA